MKTPEGFFNKWKARCEDLRRLLDVVTATTAASQYNHADMQLDAVAIGTFNNQLLAGAYNGHYWLVASAEAKTDYVPWNLLDANEVRHLRKRLTHRSRDISLCCDGGACVHVNWQSSSGERHADLPVCWGKWPLKRLVQYMNLEYPLQIEGSWIEGNHRRVNLPVTDRTDLGGTVEYCFDNHWIKKWYALQDACPTVSWRQREPGTRGSMRPIKFEGDCQTAFLDHGD